MHDCYTANHQSVGCTADGSCQIVCVELQVLPQGYHSKLSQGSPSPNVSPAKHEQIQTEAYELGVWMQVDLCMQTSSILTVCNSQLFKRLDYDSSGFVSRSSIIRALEIYPAEEKIERVFLVLSS